MRLSLDSETFNEVPISVGSYRYAETAEIMLASYAIDSSAAEVLDLTDGEYDRKMKLIAEMIGDADEIVIQNSGFDRIILAAKGIIVPVEKITDTMVIALMHSLPGALGQLCEVLGVPTDSAKDKAGKKLIQLFTKPRGKNMKLRRATRETHPEEWASFIEYARQDIPSMLAVLDRLPKWNYTPAERELWILDQRINDRGVQADLDLAAAALRAFNRTKADLNARTSEMTNGAVGSLTQRDRFLDHLDEQHDFRPVDMTKGTVSALLKRTNLDDDVRELLEMRQQAAAASPAKYRAVLGSACRDGRLRGMTQFCGAARTGRDAGRIVQLQNLPRPTLKPHAVEAAIEAIKLDCEDLIYENVSEVCVNAVRGCLVAAPGKKLVVADLSNIEGRVAAWIAGEDWKIKAFKDFDAGIGHDLYKITAGRILNKRPEDVTKDERQGQGKVPELACQFGGAVGAFTTMGANYGVIFEEERIVEIVKAWRAAHPRIKSMWYDIENAAIAAIDNPEKAYKVRGLRFDMQDGYLRIRVPNDSYLSYANARVLRTCETCEGSGKCFACDGTGKGITRGAVGDCGECVATGICPDCQGSGKSKARIVYEGTNQYTRKWEDIRTWGGMQFENIVQKIARDIFMHGLKRAENTGYSVVVRVHDELVTEVPANDNYSAAGLSAEMVAKLGWMAGLPLAAAGSEMLRYAKTD